MISCYFVLKLIVLNEILKTSDVRCFTSLPGDSREKRNSSILLDLLNAAETVIHSAKHYAKIKTSQHNEYLPFNPMDCAEIFEKNRSERSGVYNIWPRSRITKGSVTVYCDMDDDGGAWTVIQRRGDFDSSKDYFYRDWESYKNGFGDPLKDFWLGNDNIFALTSERATSIKFTLSDWEGNVTYAMYDTFWIDDEEHKYVVHVTGYRGTAGDSFTFANGLSFTTKDNDNDKYSSNCAINFKGAWWYGSCHASNLNGLYLKGLHESYADGVEWSSFRGQHYSLKDAVMKIRPRGFRKTVAFDMTPE